MLEVPCTAADATMRLTLLLLLLLVAAVRVKHERSTGLAHPRALAQGRSLRSSRLPLLGGNSNRLVLLLALLLLCPDFQDMGR